MQRIIFSIIIAVLTSCKTKLKVLPCNFDNAISVKQPVVGLDLMKVYYKNGLSPLEFFTHYKHCFLNKSFEQINEQLLHYKGTVVWRSMYEIHIPPEDNPNYIHPIDTTSIRTTITFVGTKEEDYRYVKTVDYLTLYFNKDTKLLDSMMVNDPKYMLK